MGIVMTTRANSGAREFRVARLFHPTIHVPDIPEAERWFERVFGRKSTSLEVMLPSTPAYPTDYSTFTIVRDVLFDSIDPKRHFVSGFQRYPAVHVPTLKGLGWYVDGMIDLYGDLRRHGIRSMNLSDEIADGDDPPLSPGGGVVVFFTVPADAGLQYQFFREGTPFPIDPRATPGWFLPPVDDNDPLGIEHCSHHTILTSRPERALNFVVDTLGGVVVHQGRNNVLGATSTFVALADGLLEYAVPDVRTLTQADLAAPEPNDSYYSITWKVEDLDRVEHHLVAEGVGIQVRSNEMIVTDPDTSLGIPWGFTTSLQPGDPRRGSDNMQS
ncbi:VOC family protein [Rhizobium rhizogenes]|uniref:VOC family protein n=1 Tax=Rhizobium rhizogenes TaxID=359 RepID=UPI0015D4B327|nr:glyoxalase/bleomycin resistance/dioxygenase family protein [Rhizobium rhizogenes]